MNDVSRRLPVQPKPVAACVGGSAGSVCDAAVVAGAPIALCAKHQELVSEWAVHAAGLPGGSGVADVLPSPCVACGSRLGVHFASGWLCAVCEWRLGDVPDSELPPPRIDVVYYIRFDDRIKIGTTANPRQRLARLWHDEVLAFERGDRRVEGLRHEQFAAHRLGRSEWFARHDALDRQVEAVAAGQSDPWALHARWVSEALALRV